MDILCGVCENVPPLWTVGTTLVCRQCLDAIAATVNDEQLADALGLPALPQRLRGLHTRLAGPPRLWSPPSSRD